MRGERSAGQRRWGGSDPFGELGGRAPGVSAMVFFVKFHPEDAPTSGRNSARSAGGLQRQQGWVPAAEKKLGVRSVGQTGPVAVLRALPPLGAAEPAGLGAQRPWAGSPASFGLRSVCHPSPVCVSVIGCLSVCRLCGICPSAAVRLSVQQEQHRGPGAGLWTCGSGPGSCGLWGQSLTVRPWTSPEASEPSVHETVTATPQRQRGNRDGKHGATPQLRVNSASRRGPGHGPPCESLGQQRVPGTRNSVTRTGAGG